MGALIRHLCAAILLLSITAKTAAGASEQIECSGESFPSSWTHAPSDCNGTVACDCVDNDDDLSYIQNNVLGADHGYNFADPVTISSGDVIDSVNVTFRYQTNELSIPPNQIRVELIVATDTTFGTSRTGNTSWTNHAESFATAPSGGAWTLSNVNSLKLNLTITSQNGVVANNVSRLFAVVWFTPGSVLKARRRRLAHIVDTKGD